MSTQYKYFMCEGWGTNKEIGLMTRSDRVNELFR